MDTCCHNAIQAVVDGLELYEHSDLSAVSSVLPRMLAHAVGHHDVASVLAAAWMTDDPDPLVREFLEYLRPFARSAGRATIGSLLAAFDARAYPAAG